MAPQLNDALVSAASWSGFFNLATKLVNSNVYISYVEQCMCQRDQPVFIAWIGAPLPSAPRRCSFLTQACLRRMQAAAPPLRPGLYRLRLVQRNINLRRAYPGGGWRAKVQAKIGWEWARSDAATPQLGLQRGLPAL